MVEEVFFENREKLFRSLVERCTSLLTQAVNKQSRASFIVSGGSTPAPLFEALSVIDLGWESIDVALVDERWVDVGNEKSNQWLLKHSLLTNYGESARFTGMKTHHSKAIEAKADVNANYRAIAHPFDIVLLGMGPDGHTASLFPEADGLKEALNLDNSELCTAIRANKSEVTGDLIERMTLTLNGITHSHRIILLITGEDKLAVYRQALAATSVEQLPVSAVLQQQKCPVTVYWSP